MIFDILGFSMEAMGTPWGPHGVPMGTMGTHGEAGGRQKMWGGVGRAGAPRTNSLGRALLAGLENDTGFLER